MGTADVAYVLPDKLGGVFSFCHNLLAHRRRDGLPHGVVLTHNRWTTDQRSIGVLPADWRRTVEESLPAENLYAALRRVRAAVRGGGALVANDWIELATAAAFPLERTVFSIVHGDSDYYYDLAVRHDPDVDVYVTFTDAIARTLRARLPHRASDIARCRHGVGRGARRVRLDGPLRLVYTGRIDRAKGVFDLPAIDAHLREAGVAVSWTIQGGGADLPRLRTEWPNPNVRWTGTRTSGDVLAEYARQDVFVLPSPREGLPIALLEAGAAGVVPVVSDLPSGIPEIVRNAETGWRLPAGDTRRFAAAIQSLAADREALERLSAGVFDLIARDWDIERSAAEYQRLFEDWRARRRPRAPGRRVPYGSRLDQRWLPNVVVKAARRMRRSAVAAHG
jgi:glycosyltransferase involved in cell wall biosynthesis